MQIEEFFTTQDEEIALWLSQIYEPIKLHSVTFNGKVLCIDFADSCAARAAWDRRSFLPQNLELAIYHNSQLIDHFHRTMISNLSSWAHQNPSAFKAEKMTNSVAIHAATEGYKFLAVQPYQGIEDILNRPINQLIGNPLVVVDNDIALAKKRVIERAIANGGVAHDTYEMTWKGCLWRKQLTAYYLPGHEEVLVKTSFGESWQQEFWRNWVGTRANAQ